MAGQSPLSATDEQRAALTALAGSRDRGEADRARAVLLTLAGWTSSHIAEAFGVRDDTVRLWRSDFMRDGVAALKGTVAPGPAPVKSEASLRVVMPLLQAPVADRPNWTIPRLRAEIEAQAGVCISRAQLSKALRKKIPLAATATHAERPPGCRRGRADRPAPAIAQAASRSRRHRSALRRRERGADASLPRPCLGEDGRRPACAGPGTGEEGRAARLARSRNPPTRRPYQPDQAQQRFHRPSRATRPALWSEARTTPHARRAGRGQWPDPHQQARPRRTRRPRPLAHRRVAAQIRSGIERHRARLARPQGASSRPSNLR